MWKKLFEALIAVAVEEAVRYLLPPLLPYVWAAILFVLTWELGNSAPARKYAVALYGRLGYKRRMLSYVLITAIGASLGLAYWLGISKAFSAMESKEHEANEEIAKDVIKLMPSQADVKLEFRDSILFTPEVKELIQKQFGDVKTYLTSLNIATPNLPRIGIGQDQGTLTTTALGKPLYQSSILIGKNDLNNPFELTNAYISYVVQQALPLYTKRDGFPPLSQNTRLWISGMTISSYFNRSFWNKKEENRFYPGSEAIWDIRAKLGKEFTDHLIADVFRLMVDDPDEGAQQLTSDAGSSLMSKHCELYLFRKLETADALVEGAGTANAGGVNWPAIVAIWKRHNLPTDLADIEPPKH